ncbi:hypothetical protein HZC31_06425 [Candidatus Woesearchaeota archaeon]|nr:hypothetical protein [Candidatus Woesearchaeota archaeon]
MTYKATTYTVAALATAIGSYSPTADATTARKERPMAYEFPGAPAGLEKITVSAGVNLIPNQTDGSVVVRVGSDELPHRADVSVKSVATGKELPVCGYTVQYVVSPATEASQMDPRDDLMIKQYRAAFQKPKPLNGVEIDYRMEEKDFDLLASLPGDGKYILYTRGTVSVPVAGTDCTQTLKIPGFSEGPSYDVFTVVGTKGTPFVYPSAEIEAWTNSDLEFTEGGMFHPKWKQTHVVKGIIQYEAGKHVGADFAVLGTDGFGTNKKDDPCAPRDPCAPTDPCTTNCKPVLYEELFIVGANTVQEGRRTIVVPDETSMNRVKIQPGQHLVARYDAENYNIRTHEVDAVTTRRTDGTIALAERNIDGIIVPAHGMVFGIERVLYGMYAVDRDHDGVISPGEQECRPIAKDVTVVEFVPRGYEAEAFLAGLGLGLIGGYLIPNPTPVLEAGEVGFGAAGALVH